MKNYCNNWNQVLKWKVTVQEQKRYLDYLADSSFQGVNRPFVYRLKIIMAKKVESNAIFQN